MSDDIKHDHLPDHLLQSWQQASIDPTPALSPADLDFFNQNGYFVLKNAVPSNLLDDVLADLWGPNGANASPSDPASWYKSPAASALGFIELYHTQSMWNIRQHPTLYKAFSQLYNRSDLWCSLDRLCFKVPKHKDYPKLDGKGFIHWDYDPWVFHDEEFRASFDPAAPVDELQGLVVLADETEASGGFHVVPGMHRWLKDWILKFPPPEPARAKFYNQWYPIKLTTAQKNAREVRSLHRKVPAQKGDLIIFRRELAHGNGHNTSEFPRLAQYVTYFPAREEEGMEVTSPLQSLHPQSLGERVQSWQQSNPPAGRENARRGKKKQKKKAEGKKKPAELTDLGERLLGIARWKNEE